MYKNLKEYLFELEKRGELCKIAVKCNPELEISEIADRESKSPHGGRALLFENTGTEFPLVINMLGSESRISAALGVSHLDELSVKITDLLDVIKKPRRGLLDKLKLLPTLKRVSGFMPRHSRYGGECQQFIDKNPDLRKLPILKTWPADGGQFFTLPLVHTVDPENGATNVGMYRMQVLSPTTTAMHWHRHKTGAAHYEKYKAAGRPMPVVVTLGGDPAYTYAATAPLPEGIDEYILAGFLRTRPVKLVKCITCDIEVPADCDFVIEGYIDPSEELITEGPFGDHTGFYSLADLYPTFHITCITHRAGAIFPATVVGVPPMEDRYIAAATERIFLPPIQQLISPEIKNLKMPWQGTAHNLAIAKIQKSYDGQGFKVASALWGAGQMAFCKYIVITDNNSEPLNVKQIKAEILITRGIADVLDHAGEDVGQSGKMCLDCTSDKARLYNIEILYDQAASNLNDDEKLWIALANTDPARDIEIGEDKITIDARGKMLKKRDFPNVVVMDNATINLVDSRWNEYGLGDFKPSPSIKYQKLNSSDGATKFYAASQND